MPRAAELPQVVSPQHLGQDLGRKRCCEAFLLYSARAARTASQSYISTRISRDHGEIFVLRAKPPLSPDTRGGQWVGATQQVRYWSWCSFSTMTAQTAACIPDHEFVIDSDGLYTLVLSDLDHRPLNAGNWLPLGDPYDGWPTYRQFLPDPSFAEAIAHIPSGTSPEAAMGPYFPRSAYCTRAMFEQDGVDACSPGS